MMGIRADEALGRFRWLVARLLKEEADEAVIAEAAEPPVTRPPVVEGAPA